MVPLYLKPKKFERCVSVPDLEEEGILEANVHLPCSDGTSSAVWDKLYSFIYTGDFYGKCLTALVHLV